MAAQVSREIVIDLTHKVGASMSVARHRIKVACEFTWKLPRARKPRYDVQAQEPMAHVNTLSWDDIEQKIKIEASLRSLLPSHRNRHLSIAQSVDNFDTSIVYELPCYMIPRTSEVFPVFPGLLCIFYSPNPAIIAYRFTILNNFGATKCSSPDAIIVLAWKGTLGSKLLFLPYVMAFNCCSGRLICYLEPGASVAYDLKLIRCRNCKL